MAVGASRLVRAGAFVLIALVIGTGSMSASGQETSTSLPAAAPAAAAEAEPTTTVAAAPEDPATTTTSTEAASSQADPGAGETQPGPEPQPDSSGESTETSTSVPTPTTSAVDAAEKATAIARLNLAKANDVEVARELNKINQAANETLEKIDAAEDRIEATDAELVRIEEQLAESERRRKDIEDELRIKAVEGFKTRVLGAPSPLFSRGDVNRAIRQNTLLDEASLSTTDLLEELRSLHDEGEIAKAEAAKAKEAAEAAEADLQAELAVYQEQQELQLGLKAEAERRIDIWAGELAAYAREDAAVQAVISRNAGKTPVATPAPPPPEPVESADGEEAAAPEPSQSSASTSGFQWPIQATVTSEFGYRVHPVYGSRRLHAGIDLGAAGGTPIGAAKEGVVIFAGTQGGYGRTVIVDHGGGITTLYAHQSKIGVSNGQAVARGAIIGYVGATGTATGNHLHFEVRVDGSPNNPRNYLP